MKRCQFLEILVFTVSWVLVIVVHIAAAVYYMLFAIFYWRLHATYLTSFLQYFHIGMDIKHFRIIAFIHFACAIPHGACLLFILGGSLIQRRLTFWIGLPEKGSHCAPSQFISSRLHERIKYLHSLWKRTRAPIAATRAVKSIVSLVKTAYFIIDRVFGDTGILGANGKHFDTILIIRELVETTLQSIQAYKMSRLLPRAAINQMYTSLIIINCWMTSSIRFIFAKRVARMRLLSVVLDCALSLASSIGITLAVVSFYLKDYDWTVGGFWNELWFDDVWSTQALSELQLVFVTSWTDLGTRIVFAFSIMSSLGDMKSLLSFTSQEHFTRIVFIAVEHDKVSQSSRESIRSGWENDIPNSDINKTRQKVANFYYKNASSVMPAKNHLCNRLSTIFAWILCAWGFILLVLHVHTASLPTVQQCVLQVRPWGQVVPYCSLVLINCYHLNIDGHKDQIETMWREFGRSTVERILIRHCPQLEIPSLFQDFKSITTLKIYNSTIVKWSADAAITGLSHPRIAFVYLIRITLLDGVIPEGLLLLSTSSTLLGITFCVSNLRELPDNLDKHWPKRITINIDYSLLTSIPDCLIRLQPSSFSAYGNPIQSIPSALFEIEGMTDLNVGGSLIQALPEHVTYLSSTLAYVTATNTSLSFFPSWVDPIIKRATLATSPSMFVAKTPYCNAWEGVLNGSTNVLEDLPDSDSLLMDAQAHWEDINTFVTCDPFYEQPFFPLVTEDATSAIVIRPQAIFPSQTLVN